MKNKNSYVLRAESILPKSNLVWDCTKAFLVGGIICCIGQCIHDIYSLLPGIPEDTTKALVSATLIFIGGLLTGIGVYDDIGKLAGAGSVVPITGFANSVVSCAIEFKQEGDVLGLGANMFKIAGPVIVFGTISSVIYGIIYYFV